MIIDCLTSRSVPFTKPRHFHVLSMLLGASDWSVFEEYSCCLFLSPHILFSSFWNALNIVGTFLLHQILALGYVLQFERVLMLQYI